jgi:serine/threonine protein kinase
VTGRTGMNSFRGDVTWMAPEVSAGRLNPGANVEYNPFASDIFSMGLVVFSLASGAAERASLLKLKARPGSNLPFMLPDTLRDRLWTNQRPQWEHLFTNVYERATQADRRNRPLARVLCAELNVHLDEKPRETSVPIPGSIEQWFAEHDLSDVFERYEDRLRSFKLETLLKRSYNDCLLIFLSDDVAASRVYVAIAGKMPAVATPSVGSFERAESGSSAVSALGPGPFPLYTQTDLTCRLTTVFL